MKTVFILLLFSSFLSAKMKLDSGWELVEADLEYTVNFPLKTIKAHNLVAKGKAICEKDPCQFLVGAELAKFDSGDRNRDLHMRETTKAALYPVVSVSGALPQNIENEAVEIELDVDFGGVKKHYSKLPFIFQQKDDRLDVKGEITISLKDHQMKAPSLLGVSIDDKVPLKIKTQWKRTMKKVGT
ncbi:MAG: YceI family protein [Bdellovibrionales bacterium]